MGKRLKGRQSVAFDSPLIAGKRHDLMDELSHDENDTFAGLTGCLSYADDVGGPLVHYLPLGAAGLLQFALFTKLFITLTGMAIFEAVNVNATAELFFQPRSNIDRAI